MTAIAVVPVGCAVATPARGPAATAPATPSRGGRRHEKGSARACDQNCPFVDIWHGQFPVLMLTTAKQGLCQQRKCVGFLVNKRLGC